MRKYATKTLSKREKVEVDVFLSENPEMKETLENMSLYEVAQVDQITKNVSKKLFSKNNYIAYASMIAGVAILIGGLIYYQNSTPNTVESKNEIADNTQKVYDSVVVEKANEVALTELTTIVEVDTLYSVEKKGKNIQLNMESTEQNTVIVEKKNKTDLAIEVEDKNEEAPNELVVNKNKAVNPEKQYEFIISLDYRQSIDVEDAFASGNKVGSTNAYAGQIAGYEYSDDGMPYFGEKENDFYQYLQKQLKADHTLQGIEKKMKARVSFEVNNKGRVTDVHIINCNHKQLCMSLSEIFDNIPDWYPAENKGKKGKVHYVIEVVYSK